MRAIVAPRRNKERKKLRPIALGWRLVRHVNRQLTLGVLREAKVRPREIGKFQKFSGIHFVASVGQTLGGLGSILDTSGHYLSSFIGQRIMRSHGVRFRTRYVFF
jgi:hypothetical protein